MSELTTGVSWLAVIIGAAGSFVAGWLWHSPLLFGPKWAEGVGVRMGTARDMPVAAMVMQFTGLVLMSWFVGIAAASNALALAFLATIAFTVLAYSGGLFTRKSPYARNAEAGYWLISLAIMIGVQSFIRGV